MLSLIFIALLAPLALVLRRVYHSIRSSSSYNGIPRPPLVADWIPFIGNALGMTRGDAFWRENVARYGPAFRVRAMGEVRTFVTSPQLINYVYKNSKNFDFYFFRRNMQSFIFGMNYNHAQADVMDDQVFPQHHRDMQPGAIAELVRRYADMLEEGMLERKKGLVDAGSGGKVVDLVDFSFDMLFEASAKAFFSPSFPYTQFKRPFLAFDAAFPLLNLGRLPNIARRPAERARDEALRLIEQWWSSCSDEDKKQLAPSMSGMVETWEKEGWPDRDLASMFLSEIWALEANAPYAGIWAVAELVRRPALLAKVQAELSNVISTLWPPTLSTLLHLPQPDLPRVLPLTNAIFQETLRYHVDTLSLRVVQADCIIPPQLIGSGVGQSSGLALKAGEQVICATRVPVLNEEEWGGDADSWNPDRFLTENGAGGGKGNRSMNPFGGGVSMCEGRHFASAEILTFIAAFVYLFRAELVSDTLQPTSQRPGLGVQQVVGKMTVRLTSRE